MDTKRFELTMQKFFEKAGVNLFKKDVDYASSEFTPRYILVDNKRNSYYLASSDIEDEAGVGDFEMKALAEYAAIHNEVPEQVMATFLELGKSYINYKDDASIADVDLVSKSKKTATIITEDFADIAANYLKSEGIAFQGVPFKGAFLVQFIDAANSKKLGELYQKNLDNYVKSTEGISFDFNALIGDVPPLKEEQPMKSIDMNDLISNIKLPDETEHEDDMLNNIDLSALLKPKAVEPEPIVDEVANFAKLLSEQEAANSTDTVTVNAPPPKAKQDKDIPPDILEEIKQEEIEELKEKSEQLESVDLLAEAEIEVKVDEKEIEAAKESFYATPVAENSNVVEDKVEQGTPKWLKAKPIAKEGGVPNKAKEESMKRIQEKQKATSKRRSFNIYDNVCGVLFFLPLYILHKLIANKLPKFIVYWLAALVSVFGVYTFIANAIAPYVYPSALAWAQAAQINILSTATSISNSYVTAENVTLVKVLGLVDFSAIFYDTYIMVLSNISSTLFAKYFLPVASVLTIFPFTRKIGLQATVFLFVIYWGIPLGTIGVASMLDFMSAEVLQSIILNSQNITNIVKLYAVELLMIIFLVPLIFIVFLFKLSALFVPNSRKGVLP